MSLKYFWISIGAMFVGSIVAFIAITLIYMVIAILIQGPNCNTDEIANSAISFAQLAQRVLIFMVAAHLCGWALTLRKRVNDLENGRI